LTNKRNEAEEKIKELLDNKVQSLGWNLTETVNVAIKEGHPNPEKLKEFAKLISGNE